MRLRADASRLCRSAGAARNRRHWDAQRRGRSAVHGGLDRGATGGRRTACAAQACRSPRTRRSTAGSIRGHRTVACPMRSSMSATVTKIDRTSSGQDLPRAPTSAVVRREDVEAWKSGFAFMKAAEARAGMIEKAALVAHQTARERGYAEGYRAGLSEGQKAMSEQIAKTSIEVS